MSIQTPSAPETPTLKPTLPPDESGWGKFVAFVLFLAGLVVVVNWLFPGDEKEAKNETPPTPPVPVPPPTPVPVQEPAPPPQVVHIHHHHPPSEPPSPEERQIMLSIWQWKRMKVILAVVTASVGLAGTIAGLILNNG